LVVNLNSTIVRHKNQISSSVFSVNRALAVKSCLSSIYVCVNLFFKMYMVWHSDLPTPKRKACLSMCTLKLLLSKKAWVYVLFFDTQDERAQVELITQNSKYEFVCYHIENKAWVCAKFE